MKVLILFAFSFISAGQIFAQEEQVHTWYEGSVAKKVFMSPKQLVDFAPNTQTKTEALKNELKNAIKVTPLKAKSGLRIYELEKEDHKQTLEVLKSSKGHRISPLFSENPGGPYDRALPGGVVVFFQEHFTENELRNLAFKSGLILKQKLEHIKKNVWLVDSPAGMGSLQLAQGLRTRPYVLHTIPNWWVDLRPR